MDLARFCGETSRYNTLTPFVLRGYEYATDARILVRQPSSEADTQGRKLPLPESFFVGHASAEWKPLGPQELSDEHCECGTGEVECECCGHRSMCEWCQGTKANHAWIGKFAVRVTYDSLIRSLPGAIEYAEGDKRILFRGGGVEGCVALVTEEGNIDNPLTREV